MRRLGWLAIGAGAALLLLKGASVAIKLTRGMKNNNPGNLVYGRAWPGLIGKDVSTSHTFATFATMYDGVAALMNNVRSYPGRFGVRTLRELGDHWAPQFDNPLDDKPNDPTDDYGAVLARIIGVNPDKPYPFDDVQSLYALTRAIIQKENGLAMLALVPPTTILSAAQQVAVAPSLPDRIA